MPLYPNVTEARQGLSELELSEKNRVFLEKGLALLEPASILEIEVSPTAKGARVVVHYLDGDRREFAAG